MNEMYNETPMEWMMFCRQFLKNPACIGSVIPSSRFLARKVVGSVAWKGCDTIVELGAGTGSFTKYLLMYKPQKTKILLFEKNPVFRTQLKQKFRTLPIYDDAARLAETLATERIEKVDCVVSGLPFAMFSDVERQEILLQIQSVLPQGGQFITFQYSPQMYRELCKNFTKVRIGFTLFNIPPAIVYTCYK